LKINVQQLSRSVWKSLKLAATQDDLAMQPKFNQSSMKSRVIDGLNAGRQFEENPTYFSAKKEALVKSDPKYIEMIDYLDWASKNDQDVESRFIAQNAYDTTSDPTLAHLQVVENESLPIFHCEIKTTVEIPSPSEKSTIHVSTLD